MKDSNSFRFIKPLLHIHIDDVHAYALLNFLCHAANNDTGESWHSHASITYATGMGDRAIRSATKALVDTGLINCKVRGTVANRKTKLYTVHHDKLVALATGSKVGRTEFIQSDKERKAKWQRNWRANIDVECAVHTTETAGIERPAKATRPDVECGGDTHVECGGDTRTTKYELLTKSTPKKLEGELSSGSQGSREVHGLTAEDIQKLEQEVATLTKLKADSLSKAPAKYQMYRDQLQEAQARLNTAINQITRAAMASVAA